MIGFLVQILAIGLLELYHAIFYVAYHLIVKPFATPILVRLPVGVCYGFPAARYTGMRLVTQFRGIVFARAPTRFAESVALSADSARVLTSAPTMAAQAARLLNAFDTPYLVTSLRSLYSYVAQGYLGTEGDTELQLNVWVPTTVVAALDRDARTLAADGLSAARLPVIVVLHGGAYVFGSGHMSVHDGTELAKRHSVIVVTANYRLGALGFLALQPHVPANLGLRDMVRALEWVQLHIGAFGGDASNVTCCGPSAGAMATSTLLTMPSVMQRRLFCRAIAFSGTAHHTSTKADAEEATTQLMRLTKSATRAQLFKTLSSCSLRQLFSWQLAAEWNISSKYQNSGSNVLLAFAPFVDGELLPDNPVATFAKAPVDALPRVPTIMSTTENENTSMEFYNLVAFQSFSWWSSLKRRAALWAEKCVLPFTEEDQARLVNAYESGTAKANFHLVTAQAWNAMLSDFVFRAPSEYFLDLHYETQKRHGDTAATEKASHGEHSNRRDTTTTAQQDPAPGYCLRFAAPGLSPTMGSCHFIDLHFFQGNWKTHPYLAGVAPSVPRLTALFQSDLMVFIRGSKNDGSHRPATKSTPPTTPANDEAAAENSNAASSGVPSWWSAWNPSQRPTMHYDLGRVSVRLLEDDRELRAMRPLMKALVGA